MKKDKLYLFTLLAISFIVFIISYFSIHFLVETSAKKLLDIQINSSKREAKEISKLISFQLENGIKPDVLVSNIQKSIENTNFESGFVCMFDWSGVEICHPDPKKIGKKTKPNDSFIRSVDDELNSEDFYELLTKKQEIGGVRDFNDTSRDSEIIYLYPVKNSDWIIAAHANINNIEKQLQQLKLKFILIHALSGLSLILFTLIIVRFIGSYYEKYLEEKNEELIDEVLNLSKLNSDLSLTKKKVAEQVVNENEITEKDAKKNRILTYLRDKLIAIDVENIAYIYTENSITSVICFDGKKYVSNSSLEELIQSLDNVLFFRANRQYIISINGVEEILRYGNSQLKIITKPVSETTIIISKNKASSFKKWLNK